MAWFLRGILHVESGVGVLFKWPRFIKDQVLWTECLSYNQDLREETLHSTWTGRGWGHSWKNSSVPVFLSHVHQQWENKGEKHPFISSKIDRNFYTIIGLDPKCTDLVNDKLCHFLTCLTFLLHHFFETVERSQKKKKIIGLFFKASIQRGIWIHNIYFRLHQKARGLHSFVYVQKIDS